MTTLPGAQVLFGIIITIVGAIGGMYGIIIDSKSKPHVLPL